MPRPTRKEINFTKDSILSLMQEIYNELVEQRQTAIRIQNKMLSMLKDPSDMMTMLFGQRVGSVQVISIDPSKCSVAIPAVLARMHRLTPMSISGPIASIFPCTQSTDPIPVTFGGITENCPRYSLMSTRSRESDSPMPSGS